MHLVKKYAILGGGNSKPTSKISEHWFVVMNLMKKKKYSISSVLKMYNNSTRSLTYYKDMTRCTRIVMLISLCIHLVYLCGATGSVSGL